MSQKEGKRSTVQIIKKKMNRMNKVNDDKLPSHGKRHINSTFFMKLTKIKHKKRQRSILTHKLTHFKRSENRK